MSALSRPADRVFPVHGVAPDCVRNPMRADELGNITTGATVMGPERAERCPSHLFSANDMFS